MGERDKVAPRVSLKDYLGRPPFEPYLSDGSLLPQDIEKPQPTVSYSEVERPFPNPAAEKGLIE